MFFKVCLGAAFTSVAYLISVPLSNYVAHSIFSSLYFIGIDLMLIYLVAFIIIYARFDRTKFHRISYVVYILGVLDTLVYLINPFYEFAISYVKADPNQMTYSYEMLPVYYIHLIYTYLLVAVVLFLLIYKATHIPKEYQYPYVLCIALMIVIVAINAVYLYIPIPGDLGDLDVAIIIYSFAAIAFYASFFGMSKQTYLRSFESTIFKSINQGLIVFDYNCSQIMANDKASGLLGDTISLHDELPLGDFLDALNIDRAKVFCEDSFSIQIYPSKDMQVHAVRMDYKQLISKNDVISGYMFVLSDVAQETDLLTGYHRWNSFKTFLNSDPGYFPVPCTVVACDINSLSVINSLRGHNHGDKVIKDTADSLRSLFGNDAYFIRGDEARLIVLLRSTKVEDAKNVMEDFRLHYGYSVQYAVGTTSIKTPDLPEVIISTVNAMKTRKILDKDSAHSAILTSMIQALSECDTDTESHVKRTQLVGRRFAARLKLTDSEISQLELLCVLHDIGKIGIPLEILNKPGKLNDEEWATMQSHVEKGYSIAASSPDFASVADCILHHHERWDGGGYPSGLSKESIPLLARIISVIDSYDAMISVRPYKKAMTHEAARRELAANAGTQFDPRIVSEFLQMLEEEEADVHNDAVSTMTQDESNESPGATNQAGTSANGTFASEIPNESADNIDIFDGTVDSSSYTMNNDTLAAFPVKYARYILQDDFTIIKIDSNFTRLTGYTDDDIKDGVLNQLDLLPEEDRTGYMVLVNEQLANSPMAYIEHRLQCKNGDIKYVFCLGRIFYDSAAGKNRSEIVVCDSVSTMAVKLHTKREKSRASAQLQEWEKTYRTDSMTGLMSHGAFIDDVEALLLKGQRLALLMMDVDNFKKYNDTCGHRAGDELLILLAQTLESACGQDDLVCRMGGDEFAAAVLLRDDEDQEHIAQRLGRIFDEVNATLRHSTKEHGISMGIAITGASDITFNSLYDAADQALYASKEAGRGRYTIA